MISIIYIEKQSLLFFIMLQYSRELNNRGLINPANGLLPASIASPISLEANPLQRYITGQDVVTDYQLQNIDNERVMLAKIDERNNEEKLLDSSNINPAKLDQDVVEQMLYEDRQDPGANYMGLDATDFVRQADLSARRYSQLQNSLTLGSMNQNQVLDAVKMLASVLTDKKQIRQDTRELIDKVPEPSERQPDIVESPEEIGALPPTPLLRENVMYEIARRRGLYGM